MGTFSNELGRSPATMTPRESWGGSQAHKSLVTELVNQSKV